MATLSHFQAAPLVASPSYPNAVAWSEENLVAVAAGHIVTILNPALLVGLGPRGMITIPPIKPFEIGVVEREDLVTGCLLPTCLSRDTRSCVRSLSWSPLGLSPNSGCLLAVCTTEGRVKLYRQPFSEFCAEWVEVTDISDLLFDYLVCINSREFDALPPKHFHEQAAKEHMESGCASDLQNSVASTGHTQSLTNTSRKMILSDQPSYNGDMEVANGGCRPLGAKRVTTTIELASFPCTTFKKDFSVEVLKQNGDQFSWVCGTVERVKGSKVLVLFPVTMKNGNQPEWIEFKTKPKKVKSLTDINGKTLDKDCLVPKIRIRMDVGHFPEQIFLLESSEMKETISIGQAIEAWMHDRWVEGLFMGWSGQKLVVKLSGDLEHTSLDARYVRLAPIWNEKQKLWQVATLNIKVEDLELPEGIGIRSKKINDKNIRKCSSFLELEWKSLKKRKESVVPPLTTAEQYFYFSMMLSSTVIAWSPIFQRSSNIEGNQFNNLPRNCSLLAVGGKSGKISFWRIFEPECYSLEHGRVSMNVNLVGFLEAHNTWITAINWGLHGAGAKSQDILVTGCSDGSVKIWLVKTEVLLYSSQVNCASFSLLKEVIAAPSAPVSVLSLTIPAHSLEKMLLAIGKGSGSMEIWICDVSSCDFQSAGSYDAHDQVVTGLAWAFDGHCLYSCSQDNSMHSWIMHEGSFHEVLIPSNSLGRSSSTELPLVFDSCFGVAISPGNMVLATARSFDVDLLNPMYQARSQKAAVQFFWIGGQQHDFSLDRCLDFGFEAFSCFCKEELAFWESNFLWSLKMFEDTDKPLVVWDILTALLAFKRLSPDYVEHIIVKWFLSWFVDCDRESSTENTLLHALHHLFKLHSRQLHLLNIICRRVILSDMKADLLNNRHDKLKGSDVGENAQSSLWIQLLTSSERELRQRIVAFSLSAVLCQNSYSDTEALPVNGWLPVGVAQMEQWVAIHHDWVRNQTTILAAEVKGLGNRDSLHENPVEEQCAFCSSSVPYESPEFAFCNGESGSSEISHRHKLERCATSMQVCSTTAVLWYCMCCKRRTLKLAPQTLFTLPDFNVDPKYLQDSAAFQVSLRPLCPFCGILLQRLQPEFLLSTSPV